MSSSDEHPVSQVVRGWPKKKPYIHKYKVEWEKNQNYCKWLGPSKKGNTYFHCTFCSACYLGGLSETSKQQYSC